MEHADSSSHAIAYTDRLKKMAIKPSSSGSTGGAAAAAPAAPAAGRPGRQAAKAAVKSLNIEESDDEVAGTSDDTYCVAVVTGTTASRYVLW